MRVFIFVACAQLVATVTLLSAPARAQDDPVVDLAIVGDSLSTGAATHPALTFDAKDLWDVFSGKVSVKVPGKVPPLRLWPGPEEFMGGGDWLFRNMMQGLARRYLDTPVYSWGYQAGELLNLAPEHVVIAGENGAKMQDLVHHMERIFTYTGGVVPRQIALLYTGNDLCGPDVSFATAASDFKSALHRGLESAYQGRRIPVGGADIYVLSFLSVLQVTSGDAILAKTVHAFGGETTCRALREGGFQPKNADYDPQLPPEAWYFSLFMPPNPSGYCATLFGAPGDEKSGSEKLGVLANRIRDYRDAERETVDELNASLERGKTESRVRFHFVDKTAAIQFEADDIAGDCFHLSKVGQGKIARALADAMASEKKF